MADASDITAAEGQLRDALYGWKDENGSVVSVVDCIARLIAARERFVQSAADQPHANPDTVLNKAPAVQPIAGPYCPDTHSPCERMCQTICNIRAERATFPTPAAQCEHDWQPAVYHRKKVACVVCVKCDAARWLITTPDPTDAAP